MQKTGTCTERTQPWVEATLQNAGRTSSFLGGAQSAQIREGADSRTPLGPPQRPPVDETHTHIQPQRALED